MNLKILTALTLSSVFSINSYAETDTKNNTFNYTYVEGGIADYIEDADEPTFLLGASYNVLPHVNLFLDYSTTTLASEGSIDLDLDVFSLGIGLHTSLNDKTDLVGNLEYISAELSINQSFASADLADAEGYGIGIGIRHKFNDKFEANAHLDFEEIEDETDTIFTIGARYYFNESLSASLSYLTNEDDDGLAGTLRYDFK